MYIALAILALGLLVVVHEAGHYFVAKWYGMRVERFSIGFGPALVKWKRGETEFQLAPLPLGGFVQISGMNPHEDVDPNDPRIYPNRPTYQRFLAILAGPLTNYLLAMVMIFGVYLFAGAESGKFQTFVKKVGEGQPAAGVLLPKDRILAVGGQELAQLSSFKDLVQTSGGRPILVRVLRDGAEQTVTLTPALVEGTGEGSGAGAAKPEYRVGVELDFLADRRSVGFFGALGLSLEYPVVKSRDILIGLYKTARREIPLEVKGPPGIVKIIGEQIQHGWVHGLELLAVLSVYLGLFNLLPFPALDGGRLVFLGYELATRRRPNPRIEALVHMAGFVVLFLVMIVVLFNDIKDLVT